jgi:hypothetical protein
VGGGAVTWRAVVAIATAAVVITSAAAALAQAPPLVTSPGGNLGGGAVPLPPKDPYGRGAMTISLHASGDGAVEIRMLAFASCESAPVLRTTTVDADGTFITTGTLSRHLFGGRHLRSRFKVQGVITGATAHGTASLRTVVKTRGARTRRCKTGSVEWGATSVGGDIGTPGAAAAGAHLYGTTTQRYGNRPGAIVLRISDDGVHLTRALYDVRLDCGLGGSITGAVDTPVRNLAIAADGHVADLERRSSIVDRRTRKRLREHFDATIGSAGASGTFSIKETFISRRTGHTTGICRSGTVKWAAAP